MDCIDLHQLAPGRTPRVRQYIVHIAYWHLADIAASRLMSAFGGKADIEIQGHDVRFWVAVTRACGCVPTAHTRQPALNREFRNTPPMGHEESIVYDNECFDM